jgi:hypothetical protein
MDAETEAQIFELFRSPTKDRIAIRRYAHLFDLQARAYR